MLSSNTTACWLLNLEEGGSQRCSGGKRICLQRDYPNLSSDASQRNDLRFLLGLVCNGVHLKQVLHWHQHQLCAVVSWHCVAAFRTHMKIAERDEAAVNIAITPYANIRDSQADPLYFVKLPSPTATHFLLVNRVHYDQA